MTAAGGDSFDSQVTKRGFTPPFKQSSSSDCTGSVMPNSGLTPASTLSCGLASKSFSDQTVKSRPFTSSRLSLPLDARPLRPIHKVPPSRITPIVTDGATTADSHGNVNASISRTTMIQKSNPSISFAAPVVSVPATLRSVAKQRLCCVWLHFYLYLYCMYNPIYNQCNNPLSCW